MTKPNSDDQPPQQPLPQPQAQVVSMQSLRAIGRGLREIYDELAKEPPPESFLDILRQADERPTKPETLPPGHSAKIYVLDAYLSAGPRKQDHE